MEEKKQPKFLLTRGMWSFLLASSPFYLQVINKLTYLPDIFGNQEEPPELLYEPFQTDSGLRGIKFLSGLVEPLAAAVGADWTLPRTIEHVDAEDVRLIFEDFTRLDPKFQPRDYQLVATRKALMMRKGVMDIATGGGKTEVIAAICAYLHHKKILIINNQSMIVDQIRDRLRKRGVQCTCTSDGDEWWKGRVVVATTQTLSRQLDKGNKAVQELVANADCVIADEAQLSGAQTWQSVFLSATNAQYILGFSGSVYKCPENPLSHPYDAKLLGITGGIIVSIKTKYLVERGFLAQPNVCMLGYEAGTGKDFRQSKGLSDWKTVEMGQIVRNDSRNKLILEVAGHLNSKRVNTLVLVQRVEHGEFLLQQLLKMGVDAIFVYGGGSIVFKDPLTKMTTTETFADPKAEIENFLNNGGFTVIASRVADRGLDIPEVQAGVICGGGKSTQDASQRIGRIIRPKPGFNEAIIFDFDDSYNRVTKRHSGIRYDHYAAVGFRIISVEDSYKLIDKISSE